MAERVSDFLLKRLREWGIHRIYGYPGDGINGDPRRARTVPASDPELDAGAPRGDGGVHGLRARQVHRRGRRLPGDLRPGRDPSAERPLRRQARPSAGRRDRRPAGAHGARRSTISRKSICTTLFKDVAHEYVADGDGRPSRCATSSIARCASRMAQRTVTCIIVPNDVQELRRGRDAAARARHDATPASATRAPRVVPRSDDLQRAAEILNAGEKVAMLVGAGALDATDEVDRGRRPARRRRRQGAARQGGAARRPAVRHRLDRPARHQAELGPDDGLRHAADGRLELPLLGVPARGGPGARGADRHRRADARHPLSDGGQPRRRRRRRRCARCSRCSTRKQDRSWREKIEQGTSASGGSCSRRGRMRRAESDQSRSGSSGSSRRGCPTTRSSPPIRGRRPTGTRATSRSAGHDGLAVGEPRDDGPGRAVRDRGEVRLSRSRRDRAGRRRRDADERQWRADHRSASTGSDWTDPRLIVLVLNNRRPEPGDVGAARDGGRPEATRPRRTCRTSRTRATPSLIGLRGSASTTPTDVGAAWDAALAADRPVRDRGDHRSRGAAAAAAHHVRAGEATSRRRSCRATRTRAG